MNVLKLILALINKNESTGKLIAEENDHEAVHSLLSIISGPEIPGITYSLKVSFFSIQILRTLIQYSTEAKALFVEKESAVNALIAKISVQQLQQESDETLEAAIYSFLQQVVREESDYKRVIGF